MLDSVLDQRREHHRRHARIEQFVRDKHFHFQALAHAHLQDAQVRERERKFAPQRRRGFPHLRQRCA